MVKPARFAFCTASLLPEETDARVDIFVVTSLLRRGHFSSTADNVDGCIGMTTVDRFSGTYPSAFLPTLSPILIRIPSLILVDILFNCVNTSDGTIIDHQDVQRRGLGADSYIEIRICRCLAGRNGRWEPLDSWLT